MTYDTRFAVAFAETPEMDELMDFAERLGIKVTPELQDEEYPLLMLDKPGYSQMEIVAFEEGDAVDFDWIFYGETCSRSGNIEEVKTVISNRFS